MIPPLILIGAVLAFILSAVFFSVVYLEPEKGRAIQAEQEACLKAGGAVTIYHGSGFGPSWDCKIGGAK